MKHNRAIRVAVCANCELRIFRETGDGDSGWLHEYSGRAACPITYAEPDLRGQP